MVPLFFTLFLGVFSKRLTRLNNDEPLEIGPNYQTLWFTEQLDHINRDPGTINIRVLFSQGSPTAPLFVYTGNEGPITQFYQMTGWLVGTLGPQYNASVAFIEHRYYGESIPSPFSWKYLSTDQVLWDFADIIQQLKPSNSTPVIVFGGSYGGMLAAYFRVKYPQFVDGAIASSAPVLMPQDVNGTSYARISTNDYFNVERDCEGNIHNGFLILDNFIDRPLTYTALENIFNPCQSIQEQGDVLALEDFITGAFQDMSQLDYPYPANVGGLLPGYPVNVSCSVMSQFSQNENMWQALMGFAQINNLVYNWTGNLTCFDIYGAEGNGLDPWTYQTCTELIFPLGQYGLPNDMYPVRPWNPTQWAKMCQGLFGVQPRPDWAPINYGMGTFNVNVTLASASNIVFSYGTLDPWGGGCIQEPINDQTVVIGIKGGAHHLDLRTPNPRDPQSVLYARSREVAMINQWIGQAMEKFARY
mmetsp:Transcript_6129/g.6026  ORF Transcript_6129/g.6026 Transcript_6129/m.6026 type:complete len:473 (+) Transcript_6129:30-1448(+)